MGSSLIEYINSPVPATLSVPGMLIESSCKTGFSCFEKYTHAGNAQVKGYRYVSLENIRCTIIKYRYNIGSFERRKKKGPKRLEHR